MDQQSKSFIEVDAASHFPIQNLPYGVFRPPQYLSARVGVAIGNQILDLAALEQQGLLADFGARSSFSIFMASIINKPSPSLTS